MKTSSSTQNKVADVIADRFIKSLEQGVAPWQKPWAGVAPSNGLTRKPYKGVNSFLLSFFGEGENYFLTYKQALALGGQVQKGSKGLPVVFWSKKPRKDNPEEFFFLVRYSTVFAVKDCGLPDFKRDDKVINFSPVEEAEKLASLNTCPVSFGGARAYYTPASHSIQMPVKDSFHSVPNYYATLFHEIGHSLKADKHDWAREEYAKEELVAELFASLCLNSCGLLGEVNFNNSASYLQSWLKALNDDKTLIQKACKEALARFEKLTGEAPQEEGNEEEEG